VLTDLQTRALRYDGVTITTADQVVNLLLQGVPLERLRVIDQSEDTAGWKTATGRDLPGYDEGEAVSFDMSWQVPPSYQFLTAQQAMERLVPLVPEGDQVRLERVAEELLEMERRGLLPVLGAVWYVIDTFRDKGQVWGVGRGSSCASYVLYLIGLHCVDPVRYNVNWREFLHD